MEPAGVEPAGRHIRASFISMPLGRAGTIGLERNYNPGIFLERRNTLRRPASCGSVTEAYAPAQARNVVLDARLTLPAFRVRRLGRYASAQLPGLPAVKELFCAAEISTFCRFRAILKVVISYYRIFTICNLR